MRSGRLQSAVIFRDRQGVKSTLTQCIFVCSLCVFAHQSVSLRRVLWVAWVWWSAVLGYGYLMWLLKGCRAYMPFISDMGLLVCSTRGESWEIHGAGNFWEICMDWDGFGIMMYYVDYQSGRDFVWICWVTSKHRHSLDLFMAGAPQLAKCWGSMRLETAETTAIPSLCCHLGLVGHIPVVFTLGTMVEGDWDISRSDLEGS